jgi:hypothetical protein
VVENDFDQEMKARLLQFVTGTSGVPSGGFSVLQGVDGNIRKFTIHGVDKDTQVFPRAHTCFNRIDLPNYATKKELYDQLKTVVTFGAVGDDDEDDYYDNDVARAAVITDNDGINGGYSEEGGLAHAINGEYSEEGELAHAIVEFVLTFKTDPNARYDDDDDDGNTFPFLEKTFVEQANEMGSVRVKEVEPA